MSDLKMLVTTSLTQAYKNRNNYDMLLCIPVYKVCMILKVSNVFSAVLISECRRSWDNPWRSCGDEWRRTRIQKGVHQQWIRCRKITSLFQVYNVDAVIISNTWLHLFKEDRIKICCTLLHISQADITTY